ncbi:hypothetical protein [Roseimicrobium sp. ORNL1]|uniref:hypothetical protein n=1 Tax=Roseimicrobium sp. ORNL1 TaxID=2711231 RepID=UPI0013E15BB0|nr:hypothetical protein [Roseimicrobium sp. ORNL1]QIF04991.1 hypothetical protein G5S37_26920 [Roseimicrobium sp. ORNL1]
MSLFQRFCKCHWLENAAKDPEVPITFDGQMNEFHLQCSNGQGTMPLYHCPFCGRRAPKSLRATFFANVTTEESARLFLLTERIFTEAELLAAWGAPDHDFPISGGITTPGTDTDPPEAFVAGRRVVYTKLSDTADVNVRILKDGNLRFSFTGKNIGPE